MYTKMENFSSLTEMFASKPMGAMTEARILMILLFIVLVAVVICVLCVKFSQTANHSYRCGGAEDDDAFRMKGMDKMDEADEADTVGAGEYDEYEGGYDCAIVTGGGGGGPRLGIREPWYSKMMHGEKRVEGRLRRGAAATLKAGDLITVARSRPEGDTTEYGKPYRYITKVKRVSNFKSFAELIKHEGADKLFPDSKKKTSPAEALEIYRQHSSEADEAEVVKQQADAHAVVAIELEPYDEKSQAAHGAAHAAAHGAEHGKRSARPVHTKMAQHFY